MISFRPGASLWSLVFWTLLVGLLAFFVERHALELPKGSSERWAWQLGFFACILMGPVALTVSAIRRFTVRVTVDPARGLLIRDRLIRWQDISRIEYRTGPFRRGKGGGPLAELTGLEVAEGCLWSGAGCGWIGVALIGAVCAVALLYYVLLPVFFLFSPWHARVIVHLKNGGRLIYRDLEDDVEFVKMTAEALAAASPASRE